MQYGIRALKPRKNWQNVRTEVGDVTHIGTTEGVCRLVIDHFPVDTVQLVWRDNDTSEWAVVK